MNLNWLTVGPEGGAFKVSLFLESSGRGLKGRCSSTTSSIDFACLVGSESAAPDFEVTNGRVDVSLTPARHGTGQLSYGAVRVVFSASVDGHGLGELFEDSVEREIKSAVERMLQLTLDQRSVQDRVAEALQPRLRSLGIGTIVAVRVEGGDLVIESYPR